MNKQKTVLESNLFKFRLFYYCINLCMNYSSKYLKLMLQSVFNFAIFSSLLIVISSAHFFNHWEDHSQKKSCFQMVKITSGWGKNLFKHSVQLQLCGKILSLV